MLFLFQIRHFWSFRTESGITVGDSTISL